MWRHQPALQHAYPDKLLTWLNRKIEGNAQNNAGSVLPTPGCSTIKTSIELITVGDGIVGYFILFFLSISFCLQWAPANFVSKNRYNFPDPSIQIIMSYFFQENNQRYIIGLFAKLEHWNKLSIYQDRID